MTLTKEQVRTLAAVQGLVIPEDELENVAIRLSSWLTAMEQVEEALGAEMDRTDPVPPVYPKEDF